MIAAARLDGGENQRMDLGAQPTAATPDRLIVVFFWERQRCADAPAR